MSGPQQQQQPIYPSPPLTANHHPRATHTTEENQNQPIKRIQEVPSHLLEKYMEPSPTSAKLPSSVLAAMNHGPQQQQQHPHQHPQQHPQPPFLRQGAPNGSSSNQSNKAPLSANQEQRRHPQRRPSSPSHQTHFSYEDAASHQQQGRSSYDYFKGGGRTVLPPLVVAYPQNQHSQPGPSSAQHPQGSQQQLLQRLEPSQRQILLQRQAELQRLSLATATGAPPPISLPGPAITSPQTAAPAPSPITTNGNVPQAPALVGPGSHPDSHTPPNHSNGGAPPAPNASHLVQTLIHHSAAQALAPVRPIFEQAWLETVTNVQREMGRMVTEFDERVRGLEHDVSRLRNERNKGKEEIMKLREEVARMGEKCERYKAEKNRLREELGHLQHGTGARSEGKGKEVEMDTLAREVERLRGELNTSKMENDRLRQARVEDSPTIPMGRRLVEEGYDSVDESFKQVMPTPPKEEPTSLGSPTKDAQQAQLQLEMEKMREQLQREMHAQVKDLLAKNMRSREPSSGSNSPTLARPRGSSSPRQRHASSERATTVSSTRTTPGPSASTPLPNMPKAQQHPDPHPDRPPEVVPMDVDRDRVESVAPGSLGSFPPADIETQFPSTMSLRHGVNNVNGGDQGQLRHVASSEPHVDHASTSASAGGSVPSLTGPASVVQKDVPGYLHPQTHAHPHSTPYVPPPPPASAQRPAAAVASPPPPPPPQRPSSSSSHPSHSHSHSHSHPPSQAHPQRPRSRADSPALIHGSLGRRGEGVDVSRDSQENVNVRPLTPSSPGSGSLHRSNMNVIERPGSGLSGRGRSMTSTPVQPHQGVTGGSGRNESTSSSRSRPPTPRAYTMPVGPVNLNGNGTMGNGVGPRAPSVPPPPPPSQSLPPRPGSSSGAHGQVPRTPNPQSWKTSAPVGQDGSPSPKFRHTRFSSPVRVGAGEESDIDTSGGVLRKRGREEYEGSGSAPRHQSSQSDEERARQRVKVEPSGDEQDRLRTSSPARPATAPATNRAHVAQASAPTDERRGSWGSSIPESQPSLRNSPPAMDSIDRKSIVQSPTMPNGPKSAFMPAWRIQVNTNMRTWASSPPTQNHWGEPYAVRPGSAGSSSAQAPAQGTTAAPGRPQVQFPFRKPLVTQNVNGQQKHSPISPTDGSGTSPTTKNKLGIKHLDLLYETIGERYHCRVCKQPNSKDQQSPTTPPTIFPQNAAWPELAGHYQTAHPKSCEDLEKLNGAQVAELKQQLKSSRFCGFVLS